MIAENGINAVRSGNSCESAAKRLYLLRPTVHKVARKHHEVRVQRIYGFHDAIDVCCVAAVGAEVEVGKLYKSVTVKGLRQIFHRHFLLRDTYAFAVYKCSPPHCRKERRSEHKSCYAHHS